MRLPPPRAKGKVLKVYYATCIKRRPPTFVLFVNDKTICQGNYQTYLKNQFVQAFGVYGMPVVIELKNRSRDESRKALFDDKSKGKPTKGKGSKPTSKFGKGKATKDRTARGKPDNGKPTKAKPTKGKKADSRSSKGKMAGRPPKKDGRKRK